MYYTVEEYDQEGVYNSSKHFSLHNSPEEAREVVRKLLGVKKLHKNRKWYPDDYMAIEAYHKYPPSHPHFRGCGGFLIREVSLFDLTNAEG